MDFIITISILLTAILLFISNRIRADLVALLALLSLVLSGILTPEEALSGFSNTTVIMLAGLFVVGGGIVRSGLAQQAGQLLIKCSDHKESKLFILLLLVVAVVGSFISNSGTVAIMLPIVISLATSMDVNPTKYLIPLAYAANLSGLMTLISTPTNLVISQVLIDYGFEKLNFFTITPLGTIAFSIGLIFLYLVRNKLLPDKQRKRILQNQHISPDEIIDHYHLEERLHRIFVPDSSPIVQKSLKELDIPTKYNLIILTIERKPKEGIHLLPTSMIQQSAGPDTVIEANDILYVEGAASELARFTIDYELELLPHIEKEKIVSKSIGIVEALIKPDSKLINKTVAQSGFRKKYNLNLIGINRRGDYLYKDISNVRLRFGDALLLQGDWEDIEFLTHDTTDVVVVGQPKEYASIATASGKAPIALAILIGMIVLMILDIFPTFVPVSIAAVLMLFTGCLRNMDDLYSQINWESLVLIAAMLPMGTALEKTGGMSLIADALTTTLGQYGPSVLLAGIYLATMTVGQFMSNTATAVLFAPIAIHAAISIGASPYPFALGVACAAGMPFANPIASPTNALVMTAGGYKYSDFLKAGLPLMAIMFIVMVLVIPIIFPF